MRNTTLYKDNGYEPDIKELPSLQKGMDYDLVTACMHLISCKICNVHEFLGFAHGGKFSRNETKDLTPFLKMFIVHHEKKNHNQFLSELHELLSLKISKREQMIIDKELNPAADLKYPEDVKSGETGWGGFDSCEGYELSICPPHFIVRRLQDAYYKLLCWDNS